MMIFDDDHPHDAPHCILDGNEKMNRHPSVPFYGAFVAFFPRQLDSFVI